MTDQYAINFYKNYASKIKTELLRSLNSSYDNIDIKIDDIEVSTLFDQKGDFTSNISMKLSKLLKTNPNQIAQNIVENFFFKFCRQNRDSWPRVFEYFCI